MKNFVQLILAKIFNKFIDAAGNHVEIHWTLKKVCYIV